MKKIIISKGWGIYCITILLTKNKSLEAQVGRFTPAPYVFEFNLTWHIRCDHSGPEFEIGVWGYHFRTKLYDNRHWDSENNKWETENIDVDEHALK
jgi:hypothetical protein